MNTLLSNPLLAEVSAAATDFWTREFFGLERDQRFVLLLVTIGCSTGLLITIGGIIAGVWNSMHRRRVESDLKRDMLDRGMSADEIAKVIESAPPPEDAMGRAVATWCKRK